MIRKHHRLILSLIRCENSGEGITNFFGLHHGAIFFVVFLGVIVKLLFLFLLTVLLAISGLVFTPGVRLNLRLIIDNNRDILHPWLDFRIWIRHNPLISVISHQSGAILNIYSNKNKNMRHFGEFGNLRLNIVKRKHLLLDNPADLPFFICTGFIIKFS